jgi:hypothetical protein
MQTMHPTCVAKPCCVASLDIAHRLHRASNIGMNDVCTHGGSFFAFVNFKKNWHELQQRVSGMPNSIELSKFLLDTLVESFFALFDPLKDASSFESVGRGCLL